MHSHLLREIELDKLLVKNSPLALNQGGELLGGCDLLGAAALRYRILSSLKLGTQAPRYKTAKKVLDQFIKEPSF